MAVVEIAKIQVRRGDARTQGMPLLDTGEFGWAISGTHPESTSPELFIGNRTNDGASVTTNTRILTVLDLPNIFSSSITTSTYFYEGHRTVEVNTGEGDTQVVRTVKDKLDDIVSLYDFIPPDQRLDDSVDYSPIIQRAIDQLYLNADKSSVYNRITLKIPAGIYLCNSTIYVPAFCSLIGEGRDKTMLVFPSDAEAGLQFVGFDSTPGSYVTVSSFDSSSSPRFITIRGMTLMYDPDSSIPSASLPLLYADGCLDTIIDDVKFKGMNTGNNVSNSNHSGIKIRGQGGITSRNLRITNCVFESLYYGIFSSNDIEDTVIDNCRFENLYQGINYSVDTGGGYLTGPIRSRFTRNMFYTIFAEAISVSGNLGIYSNHILSQNSYVNVGNYSSFDNPGLGDIGGQATPVVTLETSGNVSDYDSFDRNVQVNAINATTNFVVPIDGSVSLIDHRVRSITLSDADATGTVVKLAHSGVTTNIKLQYQITASGITRWGELTVVCSQGSIVDVTDNYKYTGNNDTGIVFNGSFDSGNNIISIDYLGNTVSGILTYQLNQFY
jgi:hypothetical protein